jgi:hypothetical protein
MRTTGLLLSLALGSGLVACSSESYTNTAADTGGADTGCNLFTGEGCEDTGGSDTGGGGADTGASDTGGGTDTGATDTGAADTGGTTNPRDESQAMLDFCADAIDSLCNHLYDCSAEFADKRLELETNFNFTDAEGCRLALPPAFDGLCAPEVSAAAEGRVRRDTGRFDRCVAFAAVTDCATYLANAPESDLCFSPLPVIGTIADGAACARSSECAAATSRCTVNDPTASTAGGICEPALGASCQTAETCLATQYCDQPGSDWEVAPGVPGLCAPRAAGGAACEDLEGCVAPLGCSGNEGYAANGEPINGTCR